MLRALGRCCSNLQPSSRAARGGGRRGLAVTLRPHQVEDMERLHAATARGDNTVYALPTGGGKTVVICALARRWEEEGLRTLIIVHRQEIFDQTRRTLGLFDIEPRIVAAHVKQGVKATAGQSEHVTLGMLLSLYSRKSTLAELGFDRVVIDEVHHATTLNSYGKLLDVLGKKAVRVGVTATPFRLDGTGLCGLFDVIEEGPSMVELIAAQLLVPIRYCVETLINTEGVGLKGGDYESKSLSKVARIATGSIVDHFMARAGERQAIFFAVDVAHSQELCAALVARGVSAEHVDGTTSTRERSAIMKRYASGDVRVLTNCEIATEGFDAPACSAVVMARPTKSRSLFLQMAGRGLRASPGKTDCLFFDFGGLLMNFGLPTDPLPVTLLDGYRPLGEALEEEEESTERTRKPIKIEMLESIHEWRSVILSLTPKPQILPSSEAERQPSSFEKRRAWTLTWVDQGQTFTASFSSTDAQLTFPPRATIAILAADRDLAQRPPNVPTFDAALYRGRNADLTWKVEKSNRAGELWVTSLVWLLADPHDTAMRLHFFNVRALQRKKEHKTGWIYHMLVRAWGEDAVTAARYDYRSWSYEAGEEWRHAGKQYKRVFDIDALPAQWSE